MTSATHNPTGHDPFYDTAEWRSLAARVRERDKGRCTVGWILGGKCFGTLHVNHIVPRRERPDLALDEDNCGSACAHHHPIWEKVRRAILGQRQVKLAPCRHKHRYAHAARECAERRAREAGLQEVA